MVENLLNESATRVDLFLAIGTVYSILNVCLQKVKLIKVSSQHV